MVKDKYKKTKVTLHILERRKLLSPRVNVFQLLYDKSRNIRTDRSDENCERDDEFIVVSNYVYHRDQTAIITRLPNWQFTDYYYSKFFFSFRFDLLIF